MNTHAETAGDVDITRHRENKGTGCIGAASAAGAATGSAALLRSRGGFGCRPLSLQLSDKRPDGVLRGLLLRHDGVEFSLLVLEIVSHAQQQFRRFFNLSRKFFLLLTEYVLLRVDLGPVLLVIRLDFLGILTGADIGVFELLIALHDLADIIDRGQKLTQIVGLQDHGNKVEIAVFLHGPNTGAILLQLLILEGLGCKKFFLLLGDHLVIQSDLFIVDLDLLEGVHVALIKGAFLIDDACLFGLELIDDSLFFKPLRLDGIPLGTQGVDLRLRDGKGTHGHQLDHDTASQNQAEESGQ